MKTFIKYLEIKGITEDSFKDLEVGKQLELQNDYNKDLKKSFTEAVGNKATKEDLEALKTSISDSNKTVNKTVEALALTLKAKLDRPTDKKLETLKSILEKNKSILKSIKENKTNAQSLNIVLKGSDTAIDIVGRDIYATIEPGTIKKPIRKPRIIDLFKRKVVNSEFLKYREENVVTRDAKFVVACATSVHTTKKTWVTRSVELAKIRDIVDACVDMLDDYSWVESELRELVSTNLQLKADYELLLGAGVGTTDMLSISTIASEFNPANPLADFSSLTGTPFAKANIEQLVDAMSAQISIFGAENSWLPDTVIMNFKDFVNFRNLKDVNGNRLVKTLSDTTATIAGLTVVTSPVVLANSLFVLDSAQGEILDRKNITVGTYFENKDNAEHEIVTFVATERLQFHVPIIKRDAFMKCSNVATAIAAITV